MNRIRGIAPANMAFGNFETSGRVPVDPIDIDAVEISRGPNTSVFGMGKGSGTVNSVPASARLAQDATELSMRVDNREGWRTSLDVNRVLKKDIVALRLSGVFQRDGFPQKPSGMDTRRLNGMIKIRPFKTTSLSASFNRYDSHGNRPLSGPIREGVTSWLQAGAPTWDPIETTAKINGVTVGTFASATPIYFQQPATRFQAFMDRDTPAYLGLVRGTATTPTAQTQAQRLMMTSIDPTGLLSALPLLVRSPVATGKDLVDWSTQNPAAMNYYRNASQTSLLTLQQGVFATRRQSLNLELGVFSEHNESLTSAPLGATGGTVNLASALFVDVNERLLDGRPNPYFRRPYMDIQNPIVRTSAVDNRTYRGQLTYKLDLRNEPGALRWLGLNQVSGYGEYKDFGYRTYAYRKAIVDDHGWIPAGTWRANYNFSHRYYVGDAHGHNMDYAPARLESGQNTLHWGNALTGAFNHEPVILADSTNNATKDQTLVKSAGGLGQSYFFHDRLVTTFGIRRDERSGRTGLVVYGPDGNTVDYQAFDRWAGSPWVAQGGTTTTAGAVYKAFRWLSLHGNKSYSFQPGALSYSVYRNPLPSPSGEGTDYGFTLSLLEGKLNIRVNRYQTLQLNSTSSSSGNILNFSARLDFVDTGLVETNYNLQARATGWVKDAAAAKGVVLSEAQILQQVADIIKLPVSYLTQRAPGNQSALDDLKARGTEIEINYNPTGFFTTKLNVAQQEAFNSGVAAEVVQWVAERLPVWQSVIDPTTGQLWWNSNYTGIPRQVYEGNVAAQLRLIQAAAGKSRPQVRKYRANLAGNLRLNGITDHSILRNFAVGGACAGRIAARSAIGGCKSSRPSSRIWISIDRFGIPRTSTRMRLSAIGRACGTRSGPRFNSMCATSRKMAGFNPSTPIQTDPSPPTARLTRGYLSSRLRSISDQPEISSGTFRRQFERPMKQFLSFALLVVVHSATAAAAEPRRPNIIFIISDDHAWTDYGFMGHPQIETPNLDRLAARSAVFPRGYVPTALCRPALATFATGLYAHQHRISGNDPILAPAAAVKVAKAQPAESSEVGALREKLISNLDRFPTVARLLGEQGYLSHQSGKWWEGSYQRGGFTHGMTRGFPQPGGRHGDEGLKIGREGLKPIFDFIDLAVDAKKPFFVWYAPFMPHSPHTPPARLFDKYKAKGGTSDFIARYYAMVEWFDETCGALLDRVEAKGLTRDTVVVYVADNGWIQKDNGPGYAPRSKQSPNEGGIRQLILFSWPGVIQPGSRGEQLCSSVDIEPTILAAAGARASAQLPGYNLVPILQTGRPTSRTEVLGENFGHDIPNVDRPEDSLLFRWAIEGRWKLILSYDGDAGRHAAKFAGGERRPQLCDLLADAHETKNVAAEHPEIVVRLAGKITNWWPVQRRKALTTWTP